MHSKFVWTAATIAMAMLSAEAAVAQQPIPVPPVPLRGVDLADMVRDARCGDAQSQENLGERYLSGRDIHEDTVLGQAWLHMAADQGDAAAERMLGGMYLFGDDGVAQDYRAARAWFQKAADQGYGLAQNQLGGMYDDGKGGPRDVVTAYMWLDLATTATRGEIFGDGFKDDLNALAAKMTAGQIAQARARVKAWAPVPQTLDQQAAAAFAAVDDGKFAQAMTLAKPAAEAGNPLAQFLMGTFYGSGAGTTKDERAAETWLQKSADQGQPCAEMVLGNMYADGTDIQQNYAAAAVLLQKAADKGLAPAQLGLGVLYFQGQGVGQDFATGAAWLQKAADQDNDNAQYALGVLYARGTGVTKDPMLAYEWESMAAKNTSDPDLRKQATNEMNTAALALTAAQMRDANAIAETWMPTFPAP